MYVNQLNCVSRINMLLCDLLLQSLWKQTGQDRFVWKHSVCVFSWVEKRLANILPWVRIWAVGWYCRHARHVGSWGTERWEWNNQIWWHTCEIILNLFGFHTDTVTFIFLWCAVVASELHLVLEGINASVTAQCINKASVPIHNSINV